MSSCWKKKATVQSLQSKGSIAYKCAHQSPKIQAITPELLLYPAAFNYDNLVGKIWMPEPQGYDNRSGGSIPIEVRDPFGTSPAGDLNGGSYDNR